MTEDEVIGFSTSLPAVAVVTASEENGAPEVAWGDSFFYYGPDLEEGRQPFATLVTQDYDGFDTASNLNRSGVFRVNVGVGRERFEELLGFRPSQHEQESGRFDYAALDELLPHPTYATQAWVSVLNPGERTGGLVRSLLVEARDRAQQRHSRVR